MQRPSPPQHNHPLLVSVLAGVSLDRLQRLFPGHRVVRAVPNTPALVGQGLTALAWGEAISPESLLQVRALFAGVSEVLELPEAKLDAFLALTSSGPAFVALMAEAMADGAVAAGLSAGSGPSSGPSHPGRDGSAAASAPAAPGSAEGHGHLPRRHHHRRSAPSGARAGARSAFMEAVLAAAERSRELA